jgi:hypothetical protein
MDTNLAVLLKNKDSSIIDERRLMPDRRKQKTFSTTRLLFGGRREIIRRSDDRRKYFYVDLYSHTHFAAIVLILLLSVADAFLTIILLEHGAVEVNPIMAHFIDLGPYVFLSVKYFLTNMGVLILLIFRNILIRPIRITAGSIIYFLAILFTLVVSWQIFLINQRIG